MSQVQSARYHPDTHRSKSMGFVLLIILIGIIVSGYFTLKSAHHEVHRGLAPLHTPLSAQPPPKPIEVTLKQVSPSMIDIRWSWATREDTKDEDGVVVDGKIEGGSEFHFDGSDAWPIGSDTTMWRKSMRPHKGQRMSVCVTPYTKGSVFNNGQSVHINKMTDYQGCSNTIVWQTNPDKL